MPVVAELSAPDWNRLNRVLESVIGLGPAERAQWLSALAPDDAHLAPLVEQLLTDHATRSSTTGAAAPVETAQFLGVQAALGRRTLLTTQVDAPGEPVGPYRLVRQIGRGGMGTVWLAERDDGVMKRRVALKLPRAEWTDLGLAERMARERQALAELNHPNIAQLYDAGWSSDGRPYLALEYVEGEALADYCRARSLGVRARLRLFVDIARAVAHAHARLVIHRDLKPGNVMVAADGRVKLLDFGIAKLLGADALTAEETALTRAVGRPLTPAYAAPEQILGQSISTAADIYSLGVMLYELLSGERPYRVAYEERVALEQAVVGADVVPPSRIARDKAIARTLRGDLDTIVLKALKKAPEQRYETAAALADDIERHLDGRPVRVRADSRAYLLRRFVARNKLALGAVASVVLALALGLVAALWQANAARQQAERAQAINNFVLSIILRGDPATSGDTRAADLAMLTTAEQRVARELDGRPDLQLAARMAVATAYRNRGDFESARRILKTAFEEARPLLSADDPELILAHVRAIAWPLTNVANAKAELDDAIATLRRAGTPAAPALAEALIARWVVRIASESAEEAVNDAKEALALAQRDGHHDVLLLDAAAAVATSYAPPNLYRPREMLDAIETVYQDATAAGRVRPSDQVMITAQSLYGWALCANGRAAEGMPLLRDAVERARTFHGGDSLTFERASASLGEASINAGDLHGAVQAYQAAYRVAAAREPRESLYRSLLAYQLSWVLIAQRRPQEAVPLLHEAGLAADALPAGTVRTGRELWHQYRLAHLHAALGETEQARALAARLIPQIEATRMDALLLRIHLLDALVALDAGAAREAAATLEQMLAKQRAVNPGGDATIFVTELARAELMLGEAQVAERLAAEATASRPRFRTTLLPVDADALVVHGRALLVLNRAAEARREFERADAFWRDFDATSPWAAEAAWLLGKSQVATGDRAGGSRLMSTMQRRLEQSWRPLHRALVAQPS